MVKNIDREFVPPEMMQKMRSQKEKSSIPTIIVL